MRQQLNPALGYLAYAPFRIQPVPLLTGSPLGCVALKSSLFPYADHRPLSLEPAILLEVVKVDACLGVGEEDL